ncbi:MAG: segregation and condensation protein A [Thiogranum sp.]|nr:segregation and condensation protein A [Thiogranum sp.]
MSESKLTKEERILRMMKRVLTDVAKDTAPGPGLRHPLTSSTIQGIRDCLIVITDREQELAREFDRDTSSRPRFIDEPRSEVVVPIDIESMKQKLKKRDE